MNESLGTDQAQPWLAESLASWQVNVFDPSVLSGFAISIADLLGDNVAVVGLFVNPSPWDDAEFSTSRDQGEMNRMKPLPWQPHKVSDLLVPDEADGLMAESPTL